MHEAAARNLRTTERFLIDPSISGHFGSAVVLVCDISLKGARFRHGHPLEMGKKSMLRLAIEGRPAPLSLQAVVIWTQADASSPDRFISGVRTYASVDLISGMLRQLQAAKRITRIEELRASDRFYVHPTLEARWNGDRVKLEDLSSQGARLETGRKFDTGTSGLLRFSIPKNAFAVEVKTQVVWSTLKALQPAKHHAGVAITERGEVVRLAIGQLCESGRATIDTHSLGLKLKIIRARARQLAPSYRDIETSGVPAEQYILIQCVREELRLNPEEAMHWYRRARLLIKDPQTRTTAPAIADHADALAVWEYLDHSIDPSIIGRTFQLPGR
jgi:Tfp pilus assembly protein PilZ